MIIEWDKIEFKNPRGFVVLEGLNGSGKSTLSKSLCEQINQLNKESVKTFEPGATSVGQSIRQIVLGQTSSEKSLTPLAELLLFTADRNLHVEKIILPALNQNKMVVCDRFFYSTLAFQGYGRGYSIEQIEKMSELAVGDLRPDVVLLLDLDPELGLARTKGRIGDKDSFEAEELSFHQKLRDGFLEIAKNRKEPFVILNASQSIETIQKQAGFVISKLVSALK